MVVHFVYSYLEYNFLAHCLNYKIVCYLTLNENLSLLTGGYESCSDVL